MVLYQNGLDEKKEHTGTGARSDTGNRCIYARLGNCLQGYPNRGTMVPDRAGASHKLPGAASS